MLWSLLSSRMSAKRYIVILAVLGNLAILSEGSPGIFTLMGFVNGIEKLPGGGDLLDDLVKNLKGVTADQLKQVKALLPLIDARNGKSDGGFLHMFSVLDSSPAGHHLLQKTIGLLANVSNPQIAALDDLMPLASGQVNASQGASLIGDFLDGQVGREVLHGVLGPNKTIQAKQFLPAVSELLHSGSTSGAVEALVTPGTKTNLVLLKLLGEIGGPVLVKGVNDVLPLVGPVVSFLLDPSNDTSNSIITLLRQLNTNLQNETVREKLGAGVAMFTASVFKGAFGILSRYETIPNLFNFTLSHPPIEALVSLIGGLNTSLLQSDLGNNSFTGFLINIVDHAGSPEELGQYLIEEINTLLSKPATSELFGELLARGSLGILSKGLDFILTLVDNPEEIYNASLTHPLSLAWTFLQDLNITKIEEVLGNSTITDLIVDIVSHADTVEDFAKYLLEIVLKEVEKNSTQQMIGSLFGKITGHAFMHVFDTFLQFVDNPELLNKLSTSKPVTMVLTIIKDLNATKLGPILGNSSIALQMTDFIAHANSLEEFASYVLSWILRNLQNPSTLRSLGGFVANTSITFLEKGFHILQSVVDEPDQLKGLSLFNPISTSIKIIGNLNISKLEVLLGDSPIAKDAIQIIRVLKYPSEMLKYVVTVLDNPETIEVIKSVLGHKASMVAETASLFLFSLEDELESRNGTLSLGAIISALGNVNITTLDQVLGNASLSEEIVYMVSGLQSPQGQSSSAQQCLSDLDQMFLGLRDLDNWALERDLMNVIDRNIH